MKNRYRIIVKISWLSPGTRFYCAQKRYLGFIWAPVGAKRITFGRAKEDIEKHKRHQESKHDNNCVIYEE